MAAGFRHRGELHVQTVVSKNHEFFIKNKELCIKNKELCIKNKEFCIKLKLMNICSSEMALAERVVQTEMAMKVSKTDEWCIKNDEFCIKNEEFCIKNDEFCSVGMGAYPGADC